MNASFSQNNSKNFEEKTELHTVANADSSCHKL